MTRVALASPGPVMVWRRARGWVSQPRRALALAGAYAVVASIGLVVAVPWLVANSPALRLAYSWTVAGLTGMLKDLTLSVANWMVSSGLTGLLASVPISGSRAWALAFGAVTAYAGCAIGLHYLLRAPRDRHVPAQA